MADEYKERRWDMFIQDLVGSRLINLVGSRLIPEGFNNRLDRMIHDLTPRLPLVANYLKNISSRKLLEGVPLPPGYLDKLEAFQYEILMMRMMRLGIRNYKLINPHML